MEYIRSEYEYILREYMETFNRRKDIIDWYPSGPFDITIIFADGSKLCYDYHTESIFHYRDIEIENEIEWRSEFSTRLNWRMRVRYMTQERLAKRTGISRQTINKYCNGESSPSPYNLGLLAKALKCSASYLGCYE